MIRIPGILKPALFIFLRIALVPGLGSPMFFFYTSDKPEDPNFGPEFLGILSVVGSTCALVAIALYNRYFSKTNLRQVFLWYGLSG